MAKLIFIFIALVSCMGLFYTAGYVDGKRAYCEVCK